MSEIPSPKPFFHQQVDIVSALRDWKYNGWRHVLIDEKGQYLSPMQVKEFFKECLREGKRFLYYGSPCAGWSDQNGCPGHQTEA